MDFQGFLDWQQTQHALDRRERRYADAFTWTYLVVIFVVMLYAGVRIDTRAERLEAILTNPRPLQVQCP
jgi:uncharacterized membrane protein